VISKSSSRRLRGAARGTIEVQDRAQESAFPKLSPELLSAAKAGSHGTLTRFINFKVGDLALFVVKNLLIQAMYMLAETDKVRAFKRLLVKVRGELGVARERKTNTLNIPNMLGPKGRQSPKVLLLKRYSRPAPKSCSSSITSFKEHILSQC